MSICENCKHRVTDGEDPDNEFFTCNIDEDELLWKALPPWAAAILQKSNEYPEEFSQRDEAISETLENCAECPCFESL